MPATSSKAATAQQIEKSATFLKDLAERLYQLNIILKVASGDKLAEINGTVVHLLDNTALLLYELEQAPGVDIQQLATYYKQMNDLEQAIKLKSLLSVFSIEQLKKINSVAGRLKVKQEIHIPVDAYLGREGFLLNELPKLLQEVRKCKSVKLRGLYAHFANIEDTKDFSHAQKQINQYKLAIKLSDRFCAKYLPDCREGIQTHISATSGLLVYEKGNGLHPLVRLGIGLYGMWPSKYLKLIYKNFKFSLKPVLAWKTKIAKVKTLPKGATIGYGLTYKTKKKMKIAIIPQGYADGLDRKFSNNGSVLVGGKRCRILGRVHMNMSAVDVNHLRNVKMEDEVVILGRQGKEEITAEEMAGRIGTINYEITTRISPLLRRIIV